MRLKVVYGVIAMGCTRFRHSRCSASQAATVSTRGRALSLKPWAAALRGLGFGNTMSFTLGASDPAAVPADSSA